MSGMTLRVYVRRADGRVIELRPPGPVAPVSEPDLHGGLRYPPCACPIHRERPEPPPTLSSAPRPGPTSGPSGRRTS